MFSALSVSDEVVIGFFSAVVFGLTGAVAVLWRQMLECNRDRKRLWEQKQDKEIANPQEG